MKLIAVTACPTGVAHTFMAAEALKHQAALLGHEMAVETQGAEGAGDELSPDIIAAADAVIIAADIRIDPSRFAGKPMHAVSTAEAIRHTAAVIEDTLSEVDQGADEEPSVVAAPATRKLVAITSCPTGIAHTFMAAEGLVRGAAELGHEIKVETQGSVGAKDVLTADDIAAADAVIIAADTKVDLSRFAGKPIYETGTKEALKHGADVVTKALATTQVVPGSPGSAAEGLVAAGAGGRGAGASGGPGGPGGGDGARGSRGAGAAARGAFKGIYQHLMTGVSYMLPFVVAGGLMIALSFAFDIHANSPELVDTFAGRLYQIGSAALTLFLPVFAGFIAFSIADRPGLASGFVGGYLAVKVNAGFLGALVAGFFAGYVTSWLATHIKLPKTMAGLKPILILPLLSTFIVGLAMFYVVGSPIAWVQRELTTWLQGLQGSNALVLGLILGAMMAADMGGPLNKVAYTFAVGLIASGVTEPMAAVMVAGMTPPLGLALATMLFPNRWLPEEHEAGKPAFVLGFSFITEGAIPFAARDPLRVIPALIAGSATAGAISMGFHASTAVPHGGIFDLFVPGAVTHVGDWMVALVAGTFVTTGVLFFTKKPIPAVIREAAVVEPDLPAAAVTS